ncbi:hypothetical protein F511_40229 [Dorcoceras hygrometricum]|uniref:Uncharacterized protein n=1 Tax=Dorcoceras hygrometricum TaxID=472368 RepID=A0A2Z7B238_9LAMI|nr:hypothetical protein F511_40229 [Dorcoceras hygrometricum]
MHGQFSFGIVNSAQEVHNRSRIRISSLLHALQIRLRFEILQKLYQISYTRQELQQTIKTKNGLKQDEQQTFWGW